MAWEANPLAGDPGNRYYANAGLSGLRLMQYLGSVLAITGVIFTTGYKFGESLVREEVRVLQAQMAALALTLQQNGEQHVSRGEFLAAMNGVQEQLRSIQAGVSQIRQRE